MNLNFVKNVVVHFSMSKSLEIRPRATRAQDKTLDGGFIRY
jgi:hypothetical protein